jgi:hypothetical protein
MPHQRFAGLLFLAAIVTGTLAPAPADAAFSCRTVNGVRRCGLGPTVSSPSVTPTPGISGAGSTKIPAPDHAFPARRTPPRCTTVNGKRTCR